MDSEDFKKGIGLAAIEDLDLVESNDGYIEAMEEFWEAAVKFTQSLIDFGKKPPAAACDTASLACGAALSVSLSHLCDGDEQD